jgi:hypothetical protein
MSTALNTRITLHDEIHRRENQTHTKKQVTRHKRR